MDGKDGTRRAVKIVRKGIQEMKKTMFILMPSLLLCGIAAAQVDTAIRCDEKQLTPVKGPLPYGPRKVMPPDHDLPADAGPQPVHKGVNLEVWHKSADKFMVGGMALLANGNMLQLDYNGNLYLVTGLGKAETVTRTMLPGPGYTEPLGLMVRNDHDVYLNTANSIYSYQFDGTNLTQEKEFLKIPHRPGWYGWNSDFESDANYLYAGMGSRGSIARYDLKAAKWELDYATAMRNSNGMGRNDSGDIWFSDNQGNYRPATPIFMLKAGKDYGVPTNNWANGASNWQGTLGPDPVLDAYRSDMLWIPYDKMSHSATDIHFMRSGPFQGQALVGDNRTGHLNRLIFDKVDGQTQGTAIRMTGGLEAGNYRIVEDGKGNFYLGGLGNTGNAYWVWCGKPGGLQRLTFKPDFIGNKAYIDVHSVSLVKDGLVVSFTSDLADDFLAVENYRAYTFSYIKSVSPYYGGPKSDSAGIKIQSIQKRSARELLFSFTGLQKETILGLEFGPNLTIEYQMQSYEMFYTLNHLSTRIPTDLARAGRPEPGSDIRLAREGRYLALPGMAGRVSHPAVLDLSGRAVPGPDFSRFAAEARCDVSALRSGVYFLRVRSGDRTIAKPFAVR